jgi:type II secretory pathway pseudopilin PulG
MYKIISCSAITLLEVIIVCAILSIASGIVAFNINKALVQQRFESEVSLIVSDLRLAQDIMLTMGTDIHLHFAESKNNGGIEYWLELETNLPQNAQREVQRKRRVLKTIKGVFFKDELPSEIQESNIDVKFLSQGHVMSKGIMRLATSSDENVPAGTLESFIYLSGFPKTIVSSRNKEEAEDTYQKLEDDLDERITQNTISHLPEELIESKLIGPEQPVGNTKEEKKQKDQGKTG